MRGEPTRRYVGHIQYIKDSLIDRHAKGTGEGTGEGADTAGGFARWRGLVFDFDGLILETEEAVYQAWAATFAEHGAELTSDWYAGIIGFASDHVHLPTKLERELGRRLDQAAVEAAVRDRIQARLEGQSARPGVARLIDEAARQGLKLGVASSSRRAWVTGHLARLGLLERFQVVCCREDVRNAKPDPELYLLACRRLGIAAEQAIAFEDSPNGLLAARRAGLFCVAVPGPLTAGGDFRLAHLRLPSLEGVSLTGLLAAAG